MGTNAENATYVKALLNSIGFMDKYPANANDIYNKLDEIICEEYLPKSDTAKSEDINFSEINILIDQTEFQKIVLDFIASDEFTKIVDSSLFKDTPECKSAIIFGMSIASMLTSKCTNVYAINNEKKIF